MHHLESPYQNMGMRPSDGSMRDWHGLMQECKPGNKAATLPSTTKCTNEQAESGCKTSREQSNFTQKERLCSQRRKWRKKCPWVLMALLVDANQLEAQHTLLYPKAMCIVKIKPIKLPIVIFWN